MPLTKNPRGQEGKPNQVNLPPRESSLGIQLGPPPPGNPGAASFPPPPNVAPPVGQGPQYPKVPPQQQQQQQQQQEVEIGRDTPTPRSGTDSMTEDDNKAFAQLQEEHRTLSKLFVYGQCASRILIISNRGEVQ